jgi:Lar family restriction alleviation protein
MKLKPCPFCGKGGTLDYGSRDESGVRVTCNAWKSCCARGPVRLTALEAVTAWNRRAKSEGGSDE